MNSIYKVLAVCAALLVVSSGCTVVKVMVGCEFKKKKKKRFMKTPQLPCGPASAAHHVTTGTAALARSIQWCLPSPKKLNTVSPQQKEFHRLNNSYHIS